MLINGFERIVIFPRCIFKGEREWKLHPSFSGQKLKNSHFFAGLKHVTLRDKPIQIRKIQHSQGFSWIFHLAKLVSMDFHGFSTHFPGFSWITSTISVGAFSTSTLGELRRTWRGATVKSLMLCISDGKHWPNEVGDLPGDLREYFVLETKMKGSVSWFSLKSHNFSCAGQNIGNASLREVWTPRCWNIWNPCVEGSYLKGGGRESTFCSLRMRRNGSD